jgi:hypothetical protein
MGVRVEYIEPEVKGQTSAARSANIFNISLSLLPSQSIYFVSFAFTEFLRF